jgi:hypothetical protein
MTEDMGGESTHSRMGDFTREIGWMARGKEEGRKIWATTTITKGSGGTTRRKVKECSYSPTATDIKANSSKT